jgi:hypothetical protein
MPLKDSYAKGLVAGLWQWNLYEVGPRGRKLGYWGYSLKGNIGTWPLPVLFFTSSWS